MDACDTLTAEICDLVSKRLENIDEAFNDQLEKERVRMALNKDEYESVFGNTKTETVISESSQGSGNHSSATSRSSSKRADAEAELAAKVEQAKAMQKIHLQQARLDKLESEWKLKETQMLAEIKQKEVEMKLKLEEEKTRLQQLQADNEVKVAAARVRAYNNFDGAESFEEETDQKTQYSGHNAGLRTPLNPQAMPFQPHPAHSEVPVAQEVSLAQAIASSLTLSRLPVPEPTTFTGDPLRFIDWKISFMALIDQKPLPASEKMLYLKSYLAGEARKAVEGFFYRNSEKAYQGAWAVLQDRYGSPFIVQRAFRDKLMKWPKIAANDPIALREFADFLQGCVEAIPHVKGLGILNDCEENHKLLKKLPEWMVRRWSRIVVEELDRSGDYPSFVHFTEFMQTEARIACNPIASPLLMNVKGTDERLSKRAKVLNTSTQMKNSTSGTQMKNSNSGTLENVKPRPPCLVCKDETHGVVKCPTFAAKTTDEKKAFIHENHLCFGCLRKGHTTKDCKRRHTCSTCGRRHPTCLHLERNTNPGGSASNDPVATGDHGSKEIHKVMAHALTQHVSATSSIVPVLVSSTTEPQKEILTYALLDTQSDSTFILEDLVTELNVNTQPVQLKLSTMTAVNTVIASKSAYGLQVRGLNSDTYIQLQQTYTRDFIPIDKSHIPTKGTALQWPHLKHLINKLHPLQDCEVGLLIGYDCPSALAPLEVITGGENEPFAQRTMLGWSIIGSANPHLDRQGNESFVHRVAVKEVPVATDVLKILESDFNERSYEDKYVSQDDVHFIQLLSDNIKQKRDGHFEIPLPFKGSCPPALPNNKKLATVRLQHLKKKLKANKQYFDHYTAFMEETIKKGDAEPAPPLLEGETVWYIPHHGVYNPRKPGKLRVVFDCSAKFRGISLNDTLLTGPDLINSLVGVLCRFRREAVAVICDIERMFYQFSVSPEVRNYLRFLWWEGGVLETEPQEYRMTVHIFGAASSPGCANFGLKYLAQQHKVDHPTASVFVEKNFYVDDGLTSVPTIKEAKELIVEAQKLCKTAGLRLHKFNSNQKEVLSCVAPSERAVTTDPLNLNPDATPEGHILGIQWSSENDTFSFNIDAKDHPPTRRGLLSVVASLYDPLGFVAPFTLSGKCILQELCRRGIGWDDPIPENLRSRWEEWKNGLQRLKEVAIPRCYHPHNFGKIVRVELHHFSDASNTGYGSCSYLRYKNDKDEVHCSLVMAKARVAPTKITSIPRLELSAAVTAARMSIMLKAELEMKIEQELFWTDSQVVLAYINNEARRFHVFVANRVQLIREITDPNQWNYVDTAQNPADHASRGLHAADISSTRWFSGPKFLWEQEVLPTPRPSTELLTGDPEVKSIQVFATHVSDWNDILSRLNRFSTWTMLVKVVARIKRLGSKLKYHGETVTVDERRRAAEVVIQLVQQQAFPQELKALQGSTHGKTIPKSSPLLCLDPFLDGGLLRVGGRLKGSSLSQELKHPIILPKDSHITKLILSHYHAQICHQGRSQTLMELRSNGFWAIGGSKLVARLIHRCVKCRKLRRPVEEQRMSELPRERCEVSAPFLFCGMDCFGPFITKRGRKECKRYGLIFTCLSSRAVHLEMLEDMSTDAFINALRCFISLRGAVCQLRCDQGTNFVGAKNEFKEALKQCDTEALEAFLSDKQCEFILNAPSASHTGGVWERQIRTIRNVLNVTIAQCPGRLDDASLRTLFYEAMAIVNSRPLNVEGINDPMAPEPLTPNHLILMKAKVALPPPGKDISETFKLAANSEKQQI
ncbi:nek6 [Pimephales promelas]|nr:nek6 [Pimephales promelas]